MILAEKIDCNAMDRIQCKRIRRHDRKEIAALKVKKWRDVT